MNFRDAYNPTRGVKTDFNALLEKFSERESVRYQQFAEVWRSMKFEHLSAGRKSEGECREFFEEVYHIALSFYLPPYNFQVRVGGLYILYGLYTTQPCVPKVPIRVTLEQWKLIQEFQSDAHKQKHLDVEFVFQKLFCQKAFMFVATPQEVYIKPKDMSRHDRGGDTESALNNKLKEMAVSVSKVFTPEIMQQLSAIHMQYQHLKLGIAGPNAVRPDRSLDVVEDEIVSNIEECMSQHKEKLEKIRDAQKRTTSQRKRGHVSDSEEGDDDDEEEDPDFNPVPKSAQARVKAQAYSQKAKQSKGRRHRIVVTQDVSGSSPEKVAGKKTGKKRKIKKGKQPGESEEEEELFLSSSVEDSSEQVMSHEEYLSMPTLEGEENTETLKSEKSEEGPNTKSQVPPKPTPSPSKSPSVTNQSQKTGDTESAKPKQIAKKSKNSKTKSSKHKAKANIPKVKKKIKANVKKSSLPKTRPDAESSSNSAKDSGLSSPKADVKKSSLPKARPDAESSSSNAKDTGLSSPNVDSTAADATAEVALKSSPPKAKAKIKAKAKGKSSPKAKVKAKAKAKGKSGPKAKATISPVKKKGAGSIEGKRKMFMEGDISTDQPEAKVRKTSTETEGSKLAKSDTKHSISSLTSKTAVSLHPPDSSPAEPNTTVMHIVQPKKSSPSKDPLSLSPKDPAKISPKDPAKISPSDSQKATFNMKIVYKPM